MDEAEEASARKLLQAAWRGDVAECAALIAEGVSPSACVHHGEGLRCAKFFFSFLFFKEQLATRDGGVRIRDSLDGTNIV